MAGFDPSLDKEIYAEEVQTDRFKFKVSVMSYNDGAPKMQIGRERMLQSGETSFAKLGRLTLDEIEVVFPLIEKVKKFMEENKPAEGPSEGEAGESEE